MRPTHHLKTAAALLIKEDDELPVGRATGGRRIHEDPTCRRQQRHQKHAVPCWWEWCGTELPTKKDNSSISTDVPRNFAMRLCPFEKVGLPLRQEGNNLPICPWWYTGFSVWTKMVIDLWEKWRIVSLRKAVPPRARSVLPSTRSRYCPGTVVLGICRQNG